MMEELQSLTQPSVKDTIRLLLAIAIYHAKPAHIPLEDYLTRLRAGAYARRLARGTIASSQAPSAFASVSLGSYQQLDPMRDLLSVVQAMMHRQEMVHRQQVVERQRAIYHQQLVQQAQYQRLEPSLHVVPPAYHPFEAVPQADHGDNDYMLDNEDDEDL